MGMDLSEALRIADILEQDDVISPVALACRTLASVVNEALAKYLEQENKDAV